MTSVNRHPPQAHRPLHTPRGTRAATLLALLWAQYIAGCGVAETAHPPRYGQAPQPLRVINGLVYNGLTNNGLTNNGLTNNGLTNNGLTNNGGFSSWLSSAPALHDGVMTYLVRCALAAGQVLTYKDNKAGVTYTWEGLLGLAPAWAGGQPATEAEQQVVSACLAAHTNKYGIHIPLSVLGAGAAGQLIPYTSTELSTFSVREAGFFGNLFSGEGLYVCNAQGRLSPSESTARACGFSVGGQLVHNVCPPLVHLGDCAQLCSLDADRLYYTRCTANNKPYLPITTRLQSSDIYTCGDGTCQFTERCGTGNMYDNCRDCGPCPVSSGRQGRGGWR